MGGSDKVTLSRVMKEMKEGSYADIWGNIRTWETARAKVKEAMSL